MFLVEAAVFIWFREGYCELGCASLHGSKPMQGRPKGLPALEGKAGTETLNDMCSGHS